MNDPRQRDPLGGGPPRGGPGGRPPSSARLWLILIVALIIFDLFFYASIMPTTGTGQQPRVTIPYTTFVDQVRHNNVANAAISSTSARGDFKKPYVQNGTSYPRYTTTLPPVGDPSLLPLLLSHGVKVTGVAPTTPAWQGWGGLLVNLLPFLLLIGLFYFAGRAMRGQQQGIFGFGQSKARLYSEERPSTTFADVAGVDTAKRELQEEVDFLRDPKKYQRLGARIPKGVLLVGPPGTGKTLLARAVAGEARVPFFSISATEFVEVFVDEIDAIARQRGTGGPLGGGTNDEREQTLNQLLVSMDGFEPNQAVIVMAATNRPDVLDQALLRPGRFDRQVVIEPPDRRGREAILQIHTRSLPLAPGVDLAALAQATPGMSGADLANLANEAALNAARQAAQAVSARDFAEALDRITLGA